MASETLAVRAGVEARATRAPVRNWSSLGRTAINFNLSIFVKRAFSAAFGVETHKLGFLALRIDELAFVGLEKFAIGAGAEFGTVILIVVKDNPGIFCKLGVIRELDDHVMVNFGGIVRVPDDDGKQFARAAQIHLDVLAAFPQENDALIGGFFVAIGDFGESFRSRICIAAGKFCAGGEIFEAGRNHHGRAWFVRKRLDVGAELDVFRRPFESGGGKFDFQRNLAFFWRFASNGFAGEEQVERDGQAD